MSSGNSVWTSNSNSAILNGIQKYGNASKEWFWKHFMDNPSISIQLLVGVLICLFILLIINIIRLLVQKIRNTRYASPYLVSTTKDATVVLRVPQNPNETNSIPLQRSMNENGIQFSYLWWMYLNDFNYKFGQWKHVFHKGNTSSWPNRSPGVWIHPNQNALRIYMNTYSSINQYVDIMDLPIQKWFHVALVVQNTYMDIYINGYLKKRYSFNEQIPKQNFGDLWINANGGFNGYISRFRYFDYAVPFSTIEKTLATGPSTYLPNSALQTPPYFDQSWWIK